MMTQVWLSAAGLSLATVIGALIGFGIKELPHKWNDAVLGFCAGIMLAAATLGLIVPAVEQAGATGWWLPLIGVAVGALFLNVLDWVTPHMHKITGLDQEEHRNNASINRILLFVMAIALHKLPEGMAAGVLLAGVKKWRAFIISLAIALLEVVGVWIGYGMGAISEVLLPVMLAFAGGAMLYVVSDEMIPETHAHGYQKLATYSLIAGFMVLALMMN